MADSKRAHISTCIWRDMDVFTTMALTKTLMSKDYRYSWSVGAGDALIERTRSSQATYFLLNPSLGDCLIFIDGDIFFEPRDVDCLAEDILEQGLDIVGGIYPTRSQDQPHPACRFWSNTQFTIGDGAPFELQYASTGFMAIHRKVLAKLAQSLPLCRSGVEAELYPFFLCSVVDTGHGYYELLSEDWSMNQLARNAGFKVWADPRPKLSHLGTKPYRMIDLKTSLLGDVYTTVGEGNVDKTDILSDLSAYLGTTPTEVVQDLKSHDYSQMLSDEWTASKPTTPEEVTHFYETAHNQLMDLAQFNLFPNYWHHNSMAMGVMGHIVDFGGGIGTMTVYLAKSRNKVTYVDLPSPQREFAEYRFKRHGLTNVEVQDSLGGLHDVDNVLALDVIEHIPAEKLPELAREMYSILKPGGSVISVLGKPGFPAQHYDNEQAWGQAMRDAGFQEGPIRWIKMAKVVNLFIPKQGSLVKV